MAIVRTWCVNLPNKRIETVMEFDIFLSNEKSREEFKCTRCKNYLSYLPIYTSAENENICGRCHVPPGPLFIRNIILETVTQLMKFPCRYKNEGCDEQMEPSGLSQHEEVCFYKIMPCPGAKFTDCQWQGARPGVLQHCHDKHFDIFLEKSVEFEMGFNQDYQTENFMEHEDSLFIVKQKLDVSENILQCAIYHIENEINLKNYSYQVILRNGAKIVSEENTTTSYNEQKYIEAALDSLKYKRMKLCVVFAQIKIGSSITKDAPDDAEINENMLSALKCSLCFEFALPPIYHSKDDKVECADCAMGAKRRNHSLDKIANLLNYPCKNRKFGCSLVTKPCEMKKHRVICMYGNYHCPLNEYLKCKWNGIGKEVQAHVQEQHQDVMMESNVEISEEYYHYLFFKKEYIIKFAGKLFRLVFVIREMDDNMDRCYKWAVQTVGSFRKDFYYEIEIIDRKKQGKRLLIKNLCFSLNQTDLVESGRHFVSFSFRQLQDFLEDDDNIAFKIRICQ